MHEQSNRDLQNVIASDPTKDESERATLMQLAKLTTREKLLRIVKLIGDERVDEGRLLRALIVLEGVEPSDDSR